MVSLILGIPLLHFSLPVAIAQSSITQNQNITTPIRVCSAATMNRTASPEMSANERLGLHSEFHRKLQPMIGSFRVKQTARFTADATPIEFNDITARRYWLEDCTTLFEIMEGTSNNQPFTRLALYTYQPLDQEYQLSSMDTRTPGLMSFRNIAVEGNNISFGMTYPFPGLTSQIDGRSTKLRHVLHLQNDQHQVLSQYFQYPGDREFLAIQYTYIRMQ
ncbi:DUF1579 family protein [Leptolyngbya sp. FACHB-541]|nr:DUF1579 family protein [Leptolyngbya sp. FACHB-541]MBD1998574.1 DUF1579 family protein [Leptolyngbya sp. FACHB-541]